MRQRVKIRMVVVGSFYFIRRLRRQRVAASYALTSTAGW
jgi:hypothetical protein